MDVKIFQQNKYTEIISTSDKLSRKRYDSLQYLINETSYLYKLFPLLYHNYKNMELLSKNIQNRHVKHFM